LNNGYIYYKLKATNTSLYLRCGRKLDGCKGTAKIMFNDGIELGHLIPQNPHSHEPDPKEHELATLCRKLTLNTSPQ
jgi:hypothetical protein